jgi:hypothetical protein
MGFLTVFGVSDAARLHHPRDRGVMVGDGRRSKRIHLPPKATPEALRAASDVQGSILALESIDICFS